MSGVNVSETVKSQWHRFPRRTPTEEERATRCHVRAITQNPYDLIVRLHTRPFVRPLLSPYSAQKFSWFAVKTGRVVSMPAAAELREHGYKPAVQRVFASISINMSDVQLRSRTRSQVRAAAFLFWFFFVVPASSFSAPTECCLLLYPPSPLVLWILYFLCLLANCHSLWLFRDTSNLWGACN